MDVADGDLAVGVLFSIQLSSHVAHTDYPQRFYLLRFLSSFRGVGGGVGVRFISGYSLGLIRSSGGLWTPHDMDVTGWYTFC